MTKIHPFGKPVNLGLAPIGKFVFSQEDALKYKNLIENKLKKWGLFYVNLDGVLKDGLVRSQADVDPVVAHFKKMEVDAVFMPHCNFGTEGAAGMLGAKLGIPVLLWGPRDEPPLPDGTRLRDTLCGLFASSKVLHKLRVPFTYIENCRIDEPIFEEGLQNFLAAVNVANAFRKGIRIGHIGQRIDFFWTTIINESELLERFKVEVLPVDMVEFIRSVLARAKKNFENYHQEIQQMRRTIKIVGFNSDKPLVNVLAVRDEMLELAKKEKLDGLAVQDFMSIIDETGAYCSYAESTVAERYAMGYESDIHGAISDIILRRASMNGKPAYLADLTIRHPADDNGVLLWHGSAPLSLHHPSEKIRIGPHWILPTKLSGMTHFRLKDGPITVVRFDADYDGYQLAVGQGESMDGPATQNNYVWMKVDNWSSWERKLMEGPFMHHVAMAYGHYGDTLVEACKYVPGLKPLRLDKV